MLRQAVFGRLAGYEDVNDAERLRHDPAMRRIVGGKAAWRCAASASQMGRFEARRWIGKVHARRPPRGVVLDMDSSALPTANKR
jgi:Transposase DDE domain group 1